MTRMLVVLAAAATLCGSAAADASAALPTCRRPAPPPSPGPSPGPAPSSCTAEAFKICGKFGGNPSLCEACATAHTAQLQEAGCTQKEIGKLCTSKQGKCEAQLAVDGCITAGSAQGCLTCAEKHRSELTKICKGGDAEVEALCKSVGHAPARFEREGEP